MTHSHTSLHRMCVSRHWSLKPWRRAFLRRSPLLSTIPHRIITNRSRRCLPTLVVLGRITIDAVRPHDPLGEFPAKAVVGEVVTVVGRHLPRRPRPARRPGPVAARQGKPLADGAAADARQRRLGGAFAPRWSGRTSSWSRPGRTASPPGATTSRSRRRPATTSSSSWRRAPASSRRWPPGSGPSRRRVLDAAAGAAPRDVRAPRPAQRRPRRPRGRAGRRRARRRPHRGAPPRCGSTGRGRGSAPGTSCSPAREGGLAGATKRLPAVADMGFDIVYLPPIHPIGTTDRKGPNNTLTPGPTTPAARGPSARPRAATRPSTPSWAPSTTSTAS